MKKQKMLENGNVMQAREMFDLQERNYDWEQFKIEAPKKYAGEGFQSQVSSGALFGKKENFLDVLQKQKKKIPGPCDYKIVEIAAKRPLSGKMDKAIRKTINQQIRVTSAKYNQPGPGAYFKRPQSAKIQTCIFSNSKSKSTLLKEHYLNQVAYMSAHSPGVGEYNLTQPEHVGVPKMPKRQSSSGKQKGKQNKDSKSALNYIQNYPGTFAFLNKCGKKKNSNFFGRSKRFQVGSKYQKKPGPNSYKMNNQWLNESNIIKKTLSPSTKSVYYH